MPGEPMRILYAVFYLMSTLGGMVLYKTLTGDASYSSSVVLNILINAFLTSFPNLPFIRLRRRNDIHNLIQINGAM